MRLFLPQIQKNQLFAPSLLLLVFFLTWQIFGREVRDSYNVYPLILSGTVLLFLIKAFILNFTGLLLAQNLRRPVFILLDILFAAVQVWCGLEALRPMVQTSHPLLTVQYLLIGNIFYFVQGFLHQNLKMGKLEIATLICSSLFWLVLFIWPQFLQQNPRWALIFQYFLSLFLVLFEVIMLLKVVRKFVEKSPRPEATKGE